MTRFLQTAITALAAIEAEVRKVADMPDRWQDMPGYDEDHHDERPVSNHDLTDDEAADLPRGDADRRWPK